MGEILSCKVHVSLLFLSEAQFHTALCTRSALWMDVAGANCSIVIQPSFTRFQISYNQWKEHFIDSILSKFQPLNLKFEGDIIVQSSCFSPNSLWSAIPYSTLHSQRTLDGGGWYHLLNRNSTILYAISNILPSEERALYRLPPEQASAS
jgi:hypothetical protein